MWKLGKWKWNYIREGRSHRCMKYKPPVIVWGGNRANTNKKMRTEISLVPTPYPPPSAFIFPDLALTETRASFHSGLGCGACSWETSTGGPVSQNKTWALHREDDRENHREKKKYKNRLRNWEEDRTTKPRDWGRDKEEKCRLRPWTNFNIEFGPESKRERKREGPRQAKLF